MQDKIGQTNAIKAAVGIGGGAWKDYEDNSGNLLMTIKITGDDRNELQEINDAPRNAKSVGDPVDIDDTRNYTAMQINLGPLAGILC